MTLSVRRNSDYTITVIDSKLRELHFRDIKGADLEFLDFIMKGDDDQPKEVDIDGIISILSRLCVRKFDLRNLTYRDIAKIFEIVKENILCNYMTKHEWLRRCFGIQNGSFSGLSDMEEVPMSKFVVMVQIHQQALEAINNNP